MSDEPSTDRLTVSPAAKETVVETTPASEATPAREHRPILPVLCAIGFVILAAGIGYLYLHPAQQLAPVTTNDQSGAIAALRADLNALKARVATLDGQERQDAAQWQTTMAATQIAPSPPVATAEPAGSSDLSQQVAALAARVNSFAASQQQTPAGPSSQEVSALSARVDGLAARENQDGQSVRQDVGDIQKQIAAVTGQMQGLAKDTSGLPKLAAQSDRLSQVFRALEALRAGTPLGPIDGAPPALAAFQTTPPPTEAALRLSYPTAAKAADAAGQPLPSSGTVWHRAWLRVQNLVVVRRGDKVLVGDQTSGVLAHAQRLLDAGDLDGTLTVLDTLTDPARAAMAAWVAQAKSLVDARHALAQMAAG